MIKRSSLLRPSKIAFLLLFPPLILYGLCTLLMTINNQRSYIANYLVVLVSITYPTPDSLSLAYDTMEQKLRRVYQTHSSYDGHIAH